jgi:hypothetical protein
VALPTGHSGLLVDAAVADVIDDLLRARDEAPATDPRTEQADAR